MDQTLGGGPAAQRVRELQGNWAIVLAHGPTKGPEKGEQVFGGFFPLLKHLYSHALGCPVNELAPHNPSTTGRQPLRRNTSYRTERETPGKT